MFSIQPNLDNSGKMMALYRTKRNPALVALTALAMFCFFLFLYVHSDGTGSRGQYKMSREISSLWSKNQKLLSVFAADGELEAIDFGQSCKPPEYCTCWLVTEHGQGTKLKEDEGFFHKPRTNLLKKFFQSRNTAIVSLMHLEKNNYSLVECRFDYTSLKPM